MESVICEAVSKVAEYTFGVIKRGIVYVIYVDSNVQNLKKQAEKLEDLQGRVQHLVDGAKRNAEEIEEDVQKWLANVDKKLTEEVGEKLKEDEEKAKKKCFIGLCPNFKSRYQLSKKAEEEAQAIIQLLEEGKFDKVSYAAAPEGVVNKGYKAFESRTSAMEGIMEALRESSVGIVGIHGMAGVGKTTLAKEVFSRVKEEQLFDEVAMAIVSRNPDTTKIQGEIADMLGLKYDKETDSGRAMQLRKRLKNDKRILIILDDLWQKLKLEEVGISFDDEAAQKSSAAGCKILLTSRSLEVLQLMDAKRNFKVEILSQEESMILFANIVGDTVGKSDDSERIANELVKKCAGLPVAVLAIANTLKAKNLTFWEDALLQLQRSIPSNIEGMQDNVYSTIELSYRWLRNEEAQSLFLICGLHPQAFDIPVFELLQYSVGLDLLGGIKTLEEARKRIYVLVHKLKASSLLLEGKDYRWVKMHDLIRDVSISIASKDERMLVIEEENHMKELLRKGKLNDCTAISLPYSNIHELSGVECSKLKLLMLLNKDPSFRVSDTFFKDLNELKVLTVTGMRFPSLPSSFLSLTNLQTLRLYECMLSEIASIGNLKKLDILSFQGSTIEQLPVEIAELTQLRSLDLSECYRLKVIPAKVIAKLSRLEELDLGNSFDQWNVEGNAQLAELKDLSCLSALDVRIPDAKIMPKDLFSEKLERYKIVIGKFVWNLFTMSNCEASKALQLKLNAGIGLDKGIKMLIKKTEDLRIEEFKGAKDVLYELDTEGFPHLKYLSVENSSEIKWVINSMGLAPRKAFPVLESMFLFNLTVLEKICHGQLETESLSQLRTIQVTDCDTLKNLFSFSIAKNLNQLKQITVSSCENITEIVAEERKEGNDENEVIDVPEFRQLRSLTLKKLPELKSFYSQEKTTSSSGQGESASNTNTESNSVPLFNRKVLFPAMKELTLYSISSIEKLWHDQFPIMPFGVQNLTSLEVHDCHQLKCVFTSSMVKSFVQLKRLVVGSCDEMEEVIEGILEERISSIIMFPKLDYLELEWLPKLKRFCCGINPIEFPSLRELQIYQCPVLSTFHCVGKSSSNISMDHNLCTDVPQPHYFFNEKVSLPMLQQLDISFNENLERLWPNQLAKDSFSKLFSFGLIGCNKLLNVFPLSMLRRLQRLNELTISRCELLEEIFESQEEGSSSSAIQSLPPSDVITFEFPQLTSLDLIRLPKLKSFYHKIHTTNWPSLKNMKVSECDKVEILFASQETSGKSEHGIPIQQPLFWVNKFQNLHQLTLGGNAGMKEIWHCYGQQQLPSDYFPNLKVVQLLNYPQQLTIFPSYLFQLLSLPNLETLEIGRSHFKEIFHSEEGVGGEEKPAWVLSRLTELRLENLDELMHLWKEKEGFQNLRVLHVEDCPKLKINLVPSSVSFQNLSTLEVWRCHGIIKLVTHSTAKSLVQLREMSIWDCEEIKEIIEGDEDEDEVKDEISFPQLNRLELLSLPKLESFCSSGNYTFGFPSLQTVIVEDCPKMKMFSQGESNTPMLHKVQLDFEGNYEHWEGNLNSTIQQVFKERDAMAEECENSKEDQGNPSISNSQNLVEEVRNSIKDQGNSSTSNIQ